MPKALITDVRAWPLRQPEDRTEYTVVRVDTDAGVSGWGESSSSAREIEAAKPRLVGQDATSAEDVRRRLAGDPPGVRAAVNLALLDILGKICKAPAYDVLGGATRRKARALAPLQGSTEAEWTESLKRARDGGFRAVSVPLAVPEGPTRGRGFYRRTRETLDRLRAAADGVDFALDCGPRATAAEAAGLARELESFHLLWLEAPALGAAALAGIANEYVAPIGHGCSIVEGAGFQELLKADAIDVLRPDVALWGISELRKAAVLAETYYAAVAPHHRGGPIATAAALQVAASIPNFVLQEVPLPAHERDRKMRADLAGAALETVKDGFLALPAGPGLGVTVDVEALGRYRA